jgi:hypothetical protein
MEKQMFGPHKSKVALNISHRLNRVSWLDPPSEGDPGTITQNPDDDAINPSDFTDAKRYSRPL